MESAQNGTTAYVSECRVDNMRYFMTTIIDITCCNGHAIVARSKIRKPPSEMPITWGKMKDLKKIRKSLDSAYQKIVKWKKKLYANPKRKIWKNTNCRSDSSYLVL